MRRVVITGLGALSPIGKDVRSFAEGLKNGVSGATSITKFDASPFKTQFACELQDFDPTQRLDRKEIRRMDDFTIYAMYCTAEAVEDAQLNFEKIDPERAGVIWGSGIGGLRSLEQEIESNPTSSESSLPRYNPFMIPKMIVNISPGLISIKYGLRGINYCTVTACASSTHALINAFDYIRLNKADLFITGGSESAITKAGIGGFSSMKALSQRNDDPTAASRPFDVDRDGFVLGEGAACLIVEEYEHAKKRGAKIYAELVGTGMTADAYHMTAPHPKGLGVIKVMKKTLKESGLNEDDIDYINVHGTSTPLGDVTELNTIQEVFGDSAYKMNISSTKSMTGHLLGAAGALEAAASIIALKENFIPPTINLDNPDPEIDPKLRLTPHEAEERNVRAVMSNTFGFGGHNASVIMKKI